MDEIDKLLDELDALEKAATPGPWEAQWNEYIGTRIPNRAGAMVLRPFVTIGTRSGNDYEAVKAEQKANHLFLLNLRNAAPALLSELRKCRAANRWIPTSERLPEDLQEVLFYSGDVVIVGYFSLGTFIHQSNGVAYHTKYWMPIPNSPKESEETK